MRRDATERRREGSRAPGMTCWDSFFLTAFDSCLCLMKLIHSLTLLDCCSSLQLFVRAASYYSFESTKNVFAATVVQVSKSQSSTLDSKYSNHSSVLPTTM